MQSKRRRGSPIWQSGPIFCQENWSTRQESRTLARMSNLAISGEDVQAARAAHLRELFEPWSLRRLEARTGIGRGTLQTRFNGTTAVTMADIEILAPVVRMTPVELFSELLAVTPNNEKGPASEETGPDVPPTGVEPATYGTNVRQLRPRVPARLVPGRERIATVTSISGKRAS